MVIDNQILWLSITIMTINNLILWLWKTNYYRQIGFFELIFYLKVNQNYIKYLENKTINSLGLNIGYNRPWALVLMHMYWNQNNYLLFEVLWFCIDLRYLFTQWFFLWVKTNNFN